MVDEAHAFGICGAQGRGLADELGVTPDIHMGTLSKAAGLHGGYICGSRGLIDLLINRARSFIYSTAPPPAVAAAACVVVRDILPTAEGERIRARLWTNVREFAERMSLEEPRSAIVPVIVGREEEAMQRSREVLEAGFLVPAIRYPTVARGAARLRVTLTAAHESAEIEGLVRVLRGG